MSNLSFSWNPFGNTIFWMSCHVVVKVPFVTGLAIFKPVGVVSQRLKYKLATIVRTFALGQHPAHCTRARKSPARVMARLDVMSGARNATISQRANKRRPVGGR